jgi:hypothetical protein
MAAAENMSQVTQRTAIQLGAAEVRVSVAAEVRVSKRQLGTKTQVGPEEGWGVSDNSGHAQVHSAPGHCMQNKTLSPSVVYVFVCFALGGKVGFTLARVKTFASVLFRRTVPAFRAMFLSGPLCVCPGCNQLGRREPDRCLGLSVRLSNQFNGGWGVDS